MTISPPSSPSEVISALSLALSPNSESRRQSLQALQAWSTLPGYYSYLTKIFTTRTPTNQDDEIRLQSLLQFKNGVEKYWRKHCNNAISQQEKSEIRPLILKTMIDEPNRIIAKNLAVTLGKLARLDYGTDWNDLPESLLNCLHASTTLLTLHRSLLYLHSTVKSLSSNRVPRGKLLMKKLTELLFTPLVNVHSSLLSKAIERLQRDGLGGEQLEIEEIECALLAFKSLRFLTIYGDSNPSSNEVIKEYFVSTLPTFTSILSLRISILSSSSIIETPRLIFLTKHLIGYTKLYRGLIDHSIQVFDQMGITRGVLELVWQIVKNACSSTDDSSLVQDSYVSQYPTRLLIPSLLLLKSTLSSWDGQTPLTIPINFVVELTEILIEKCLVMNLTELNQWELDPEEFINEQVESQGKWEFELRPCSEYLLKSLISGYKLELGPLLRDYLERDTRLLEPKNLKDLLFKDAVYTAIGKNLIDLTESINFNDWLKNSLVREVADRNNHRIIQRRIAWLLGLIISEVDSISGSKESTSLVYSLILHLLSRSNNQAIRLTAATSLGNSLDTWDFDLLNFLPHLEQSIRELVDLLGQVELSDTLMRLNKTLGVVISRVGQHVVPFAQELSTILFNLWNNSARQDLPHFQTSILVTMTSLATALGEGGGVGGGLLDSQATSLIIQTSVDPLKPCHVYLQEDALELWQVLLKNSLNLSLEMFRLLPMLIGLLDQGTDVLPKCLSIYESYLLLDPNKVLELTANEFFNSCSSLLDGLSLQAVKTVLHCINLIFKTSTSQKWAQALDESGCFQRLLQVVSQPDTSALISTKYLVTISRIILSDSSTTFHQLLISTGTRTQTSSDVLLSIVLDQLIERCDNLSSGGQRKIVALALGELIVTKNPNVLSRLGDLVALWSGVLAQTEETEQGDAELYHIPDDYTSDVEYDPVETLESLRKTALSTMDPMITNKLSQFIGDKLAQAQELNGGVEQFAREWLSRVDPIVTEELVKRLQGTLKG